jgi:hypothetical protein
MPDATYIGWAAERLNAPESIAEQVWSSANSTVYRFGAHFLKIGENLGS